MQLLANALIDGELVSNEESFDVENPATEECVARLGTSTASDFERAVHSARTAFDVGTWPRLSLSERANHIMALQACLAQRRESLVETVIAETGCPRWLSEAEQVGSPLGDFQRFVDLVHALPEWEYDEVPLEGHVLGATPLRVSTRLWEPIGVVAAMTPYNFPLLTAVNKVVPALLTGCTVVLRPSPLAPLQILALAEAVVDSGLPRGVLNIVVEAESEGGQILTKHRDVDLVTFTGSTAVGRMIATQAAGRVKRLVMELGGNSVQLYLPSALEADVNEAIAGARAVFMSHAGQACSAQRRMLVPSSRKAEVVDALREEASHMALGDPADPRTQIGPLISRTHRQSCEDYVAQAVSDGGQLIVGGSSTNYQGRGWFFEPTVLDVAGSTSSVFREEVFGPYITVQSYDDVNEAIAIANDSDYGLSGAVYTHDLDEGYHVARRIRSGTVQVNAAWPGTFTPFGGIRQSGFGYERGALGVREFQFAKHLVIAAPRS